MKKLTVPQQYLLDKLNKGWILTWHLSTSSGGYYKIQIDAKKLEERKYEFVKGSVVNALKRKGLITIGKQLWNQNIYKLINNKNSISKGDTVKYTDKAKEVMPLMTDNKKHKVIDINGDNILLDGDISINAGWLEKV